MTLESDTKDHISFTLTIGGAKENVIVERVQGQEALSELFVYEIDVSSTAERAEQFSEALGREIELEIVRDEVVVRRTRGIVTEVQSDGVALLDQTRRTTLIVMPKLAELQYVKTSRTFKRSDDPSQGNTVKDIVLRLLKERNVEADWRVNRDLDKYVLRMQFEETNYEFMRRLLAFEGIHFHFSHGPEKTTVVFTNAPLEDKGRPTLAFREGSGGVTGDDVRNIRRGEKIRTDAVRLTDFNFDRPELEMTATARRPEGARIVDEHPGLYGLPDSVGKGRAQRRLEELNSSGARVFGESNCARLSAGHRLAVAGHKDNAFNGELVATHVLFTASARGVGGSAPPIAVEFRAVRDTVPLRPVNRPWPLPPIQTAKVVGPTPNEPQTHEQGLVKVRFYWDVFTKDGEVSEEDNCALVRVGTDMAGPGFGSVMWPRVGMEVVVDFLNGKLDEPVVVRTLYNEVNKVPYDLPTGETRSGFKSSTVGGEGHNEWFFEDRAGKELVFLHAQRDRTTTVNGSHHESVGGSQSVSVGGSQSVSVGGMQTETVGGMQTVTVGGMQTVTVGGGQKVTVKKGRTVTVETGDEGHNVLAGNRTVATQLTDALAANNVLIEARASVVVDGGSFVLLSSGKPTRILIDQAGALRLFAPIKIEAVVNGNGLGINSNGKTVLQADDTITIHVGANSVKVTTSGVEISGTTSVKISGGGSTVVLDGSSASVTAPVIKLNS